MIPKITIVDTAVGLGDLHNLKALVFNGLTNTKGES